MLAIRSGNRYSVVLGLLIQDSSGEDTFSGRESPCVIISYSNTGGVVGGPLPALAARPSRQPTGLMRTPHTPGGYQPHAKDLLIYFVSYTKVGVFISFTRL